MPFSSLIGNERIARLLKRAVAEGRIGQSLILAGPRGIGKHQFGLALAQAVNCDRPVEGDACGECLPCRKIAAGEHPDVQTYVRDGSFIKIDPMREMARNTQYLPYEGKKRVYLLDEADRLNPPAAGSILKTLEEPPATTLILLITDKPYALIETIRSRCQMLSFGPLTTEELETHLRTTGKRPEGEIHMLARLARGSVGRALEIDLDQYRKIRTAMLELVDTMGVSRDSIRLMRAAEYLGRKLEREEFEEHIDVLLVLLSDVFHLKLGEPAASLTNSDMAERLTRISEAVTFDEIAGWVDSIELMLQGLVRNVNRELAMDAVLLQV